MFQPLIPVGGKAVNVTVTEVVAVTTVPETPFNNTPAGAVQLYPVAPATEEHVTVPLPPIHPLTGAESIVIGAGSTEIPVTLTETQAVVPQIPSARTKYVCVPRLETVTLTEAPVLIGAPARSHLHTTPNLHQNLSFHRKL